MAAHNEAILTPSPLIRTPFDDRPALQTCGAVIRQHRLALGLKQRDLAARIGLKKNAISALEIGEAWLAPRHLLHLAHVLGIDTWHLFPPPPTDPDSSVMRLLLLLAQHAPAMTYHLIQMLENATPVHGSPSHKETK